MKIENDSIAYIWVKKTYDSRDWVLNNRIILHKFGSKVIGAFKLPLVNMINGVLPEGIKEVSPEEELICDKYRKIEKVEQPEISEKTARAFEKLGKTLKLKKTNFLEEIHKKENLLDNSNNKENNIDSLPNNW